MLQGRIYTDNHSQEIFTILEKAATRYNNPAPLYYRRNVKGFKNALNYTLFMSRFDYSTYDNNALHIYYVIRPLFEKYLGIDNIDYNYISLVSDMLAGYMIIDN